MFLKSDEIIVKKRRLHMKSQAGVDFTKVLSTTFTLVDPKSIKNTVKS